MKKLLVFFLIIIISLLSSCRKRPVKGPEDALVLLKWCGIPNFVDDMDKNSLTKAVNKSLDYLMRVPQDNVYVYGPDRYTTAEIVESMETFLNILKDSPDNKSLNKAIRSQFNIYRSAGLDRKVQSSLQDTMNRSLKGV